MGHTVVVEGVLLFSNPTRWNLACLWPYVVTKFRQKFGVWSKELSQCFSKLVISISMCQQFWSNLEILRMEIRNTSITHRKSYQLRSVNTVRWESWNVTTQPWQINNRKSDVIPDVVNADMNITTNNFYISKTKERISLSEVFALFNWNHTGYISGKCFSNSGFSMLNISSRYREVSLNMSMRS